MLLAKKALLRKKFLVYPLILGPQSYPGPLIIEQRQLYTSQYLSTSICVNAPWVHKNVGNHFRNMELRRL